MLKTQAYVLGHTKLALYRFRPIKKDAKSLICTAFFFCVSVNCTLETFDSSSIFRLGVWSGSIISAQY